VKETTVTDPALPPAPPPVAYPAAPAPVPGKTLGIVGLIVAFFFPLIGLILSIVARSQSKRVGVPNTQATVGIVLGIVFIVLYIVGAILVVSLFVAACSTGAATCTGSSY
jgi:quinol-cytochrome oxidoreductase complex cytochrome b subunit